MSATPDYELIDALDCPVCGRTATLVVPVCTDGHGDDCPDRLCIWCDSALVLDPIVSRPPDRRHSRIA